MQRAAVSEARQQLMGRGHSVCVGGMAAVRVAPFSRNGSGTSCGAFSPTLSLLGTSTAQHLRLGLLRPSLPSPSTARLLSTTTSQQNCLFVERKQWDQLPRRALHPFPPASGQRTRVMASSLDGLLLFPLQQQRRNMGLWSEFKKSLKDRTEQSKEWQESVQELERLKESEGVKKAKESVSSLKDKTVQSMKDKVLTRMAAGKERVAGGLSSLGGTLRGSLDRFKKTTKADVALDKTKEATDQVFQRLEEGWEGIEKKTEEWQTRAKETAVFKAAKSAQDMFASRVDTVKKNIPLLEQPKHEGEGTDAAGAKGGLVVKSSVTSAVEKRWQDMVQSLRNSTPYRSAVNLKEKVLESDHPLVQRGIEMGESMAYYMKRAGSLLNSSNPSTKAFALASALDPKFSALEFKRHLREKFLPDFFDHMRNNDQEALQKYFHEEALRAIITHNQPFHSRLISVNELELVGEVTEDVPLLISEAEMTVVHFTPATTTEDGTKTTKQQEDLRREIWRMAFLLNEEKQAWQIHLLEVLSSEETWW
ncbi:hypothetical protein QOT17_015171 [Balamuthia mandrillaris]